MTGVEHMSVDTSKLDEWNRMQAERTAASSNEFELPLYGGGGNGPMDTSVTIKDYIDSRDDAVESRLSAKLDKIPTKGTVWGAMATAVGILVAIAAFGADRFDGGVGASSLVREQQAVQKKADEAQDAKIELMNQKLDILIKQTASK